MKLKKYLTLLYGLSLVIMMVSCGPSADSSASPSAPKLEAISLHNVIIKPGDNYEFKPELTPTDIAIEDIQLEWESSDTDVATVSDGKLIGKSDGTTVITVKSSEGITASCFVTVEAPSAYDKLSSTDKELYDMLIDASSSLKTPSSLTLRSVSILKEDALRPYKYQIEISAMNGFGGNSIGYYLWDGGKVNFITGNVRPTQIEGTTSMYDINRINAAIEEYFNK